MNSWNNLSIKEKADVMKVAIQNGITTLPEIKAKYNEFAEGGNFYSGEDEPTQQMQKKPITTGGAGYIPAMVDDPVAQTRKYLYTHVLPISDYNIAETIKGALKGKFEYKKRNDPKFDYEEEYPQNTDYTTIGGTKAPLSVVDGIWAEYLQIPQKDRKKFVGPKLRQSKYAPSIGRNKNNKYYALPLTSGAKRLIVNEAQELPHGKNKVTNTLETLGRTVFNLGDHTLGRGYDEKGDYVSYYDVFDLNPFSDKYHGTNIPLLNKLEDVSFGMGKPVHFYDRIYLDDYYGVKEPTHAAYLPEVTVFGKKKAKGGNLFSGTENHSSQMHQGHVYDVLPRMLKNAGLDVRVTSGYRKAGTAGKAGSKSWHTRHGAVDIVPQGKTTFSDIEDALYNNPEISNYMLANGFGLIDESGRTEESKATMRKTGATGAHFHIGKDSAYAKRYADRMAKNVPQIIPESPSIQTYDAPAFMPSNPQAFFNPFTYQTPQIEPEIEQPLVETALNNAYTPEQLEREQRMNNLNTLSMVLGMTSPQGSDNSFVNTLGMLAGNMSAYGGNIYGFGDWLKKGWNKLLSDNNSVDEKSSKKKTVYKAKYSGKVFNTAKEAALDNRAYLNDASYRYVVKSQKVKKPTEYEIPFIESKRRVLSNAGLATGAVISENMLDSIAKYATQANLPIKTALGLAAKESTFGNPTDDTSVYKILSPEKVKIFKSAGTGQHINEGHSVYPTNLVNFHVDDYTPYDETLSYATKKAKGKDFKIDLDKLDELLIGGEKYADSRVNEYENKYGNYNKLRNAFLYYKEHPNKYNSNQSNYSQLVEKRADEVWNSPEIQNWYKNSIYNKRAYGGHIYDGISERSQKMNRPNIFRYDDGRYVYQAAPNAEEIDVTPINTLMPDASQWTYQDAEGKIYTPNTQVNTGTITEAEDTNPLMRAANNYIRELEWRAKNDPSSIALQGKYTMPIVLSPLLAKAGEAAYAVGLTPYIEAGLTSAFAAHGLNHWMNEGIDSGLDAAMTAMEIAPLGGLAKPMWNAGKEALNSYKYTHSFGKPVIPSNYNNLKPAEIIQGEENWASSLPGVKDYSITRVEPYSGYTPINQSQEYKNFVDDVMQGNSWGRNRGAVYSTKNRDFGAGITDSEQLGAGAEATVLKNPDDPSRVLKFSRDSSLASETREAAVENAEQYASKRNMAPYNMPLSVEGAYESNGSFYPVFSQERITPVSTENILAVDNKIGELNNSVGGGMYYPGTSRVNNILSENDIARTIDFKPENVGITSDGSIMGIDLGIDYSGRVPKGVVSPQITAENVTTQNESIKDIFRRIVQGKSDNINMTKKMAEMGRKDLLDEISSPWYKERWKKATNGDDEQIDNLLSRMRDRITDVSMDYSKTTEQLSGKPGFVTYGAVVPREPNRFNLSDGTPVTDYNTGLDVQIASNRGKEARNTAYHELQHYLTNKATGITQYPSLKFITNGPYEPLITPINNGELLIGRGDAWQHYIMDQNEALLPKRSLAHEKAVYNPNSLKKEIVDLGKTPEEADNVILKLKDEAQDMMDIQEERAHLKTWFTKEILPLLKNPNDAIEIEKLLIEHPDIMKKRPEKIKTLMEVLRPGSVKDYAKYLAESLGIVPFIINTNSKKK